MSSSAFNEDDVLPTPETAFSARGEAPRRAGTATPAKSGAGKLVFFGLLGAVIIGIAAVAFIKMRPAGATVENVATTGSTAMAAASEAMPSSEAETLFASSVDASVPPESAAAPAASAPSMPNPAGAMGESVMAAETQDAVAAQAPADAAPVARPEVANGAMTSAAPGAAAPADNDALVQRIAALEATIATLSKQVDGMDRDLNIVESQMPALRAQARQAAPPRTTPRAAAAPAPRPAAATPTVPAAAPTVGFKLKAVLEGQAWIEGRDGQTYTVAAGDTVDGLGVVIEIDAVRNEVRFPAGVVLGFR